MKEFDKIIQAIPYDKMVILVVGMFKLGVSVSVLSGVFDLSIHAIEELIREKMK